MTLRRGLTFVLVLMVAWLQVRIWIGKGSLAEVSTLSARVSKEQVANETKAQRNKVLRAEVVDLKHGEAAIEEKARSELGLVKAGETFFLLVDPKKATDSRSLDQ